MKPGDLRRIAKGGLGLPNQEYWENDESWSSLPRGCRGDLVLVVVIGTVPDAASEWVRVIHPVHGLRDIRRDDLVPVQPDR